MQGNDCACLLPHQTQSPANKSAHPGGEGGAGGTMAMSIMTGTLEGALGMTATQ